MTTIRELHSMAYLRMPKAEVHDRLHEMAEGIGVASLRDCTPAQLDELASHVRQLPLRDPPAPRSGYGRYGPRERGTGSPETLKRSRSGNTHGTLRPITAGQWILIDRIAAEMDWSKDDLSNALRDWFGDNWKEQIVTTTDGVEVVRRLKAVKASKAKGGSR